jgi:CRP-like cAMP-binding protein
MTPVNALKRIHLFSSLSDQDCEQLSKLLRLQTLHKGEVLFRKGDEGATFYMILSGQIKISVSKRHNQMTLAILGRDEFLGEMALLDGQPRSADAVSTEQSSLYALNRKDFLSFLMTSEHAIHAVLSALSIRLRKTDNQLTEMYFLNVHARLGKKLVELIESRPSNVKNDPDHILNITQDELGHLVGVSRESINKALKILRKKGILSTSRNTIRIHNLDLLKQRL